MGSWGSPAESLWARFKKEGALDVDCVPRVEAEELAARNLFLEEELRNRVEEAKVAKARTLEYVAYVKELEQSVYAADQDFFRMQRDFENQTTRDREQIRELLSDQAIEKTRREELESKLSELQVSLEQGSFEVEFRLQGELATAVEKMAALEEENAVMKDQLDAAVAGRADFEAQYEQAAAQLLTVRGNLEAVKLKTADLEQQNALLITQLVEANADRVDREAQYGQVQAQLVAARSNIEAVEGKLAGFEQETASLREQLEAATAAGVDKEAQYRQAQAQLVAVRADLEAQIDQAQAQVAAAEKSRVDALARCNEAESNAQAVLLEAQRKEEACTQKMLIFEKRMEEVSVSHQQLEQQQQLVQESKQHLAARDRDLCIREAAVAATEKELQRLQVFLRDSEASLNVRAAELDEQYSEFKQRNREVLEAQAEIIQERQEMSLLQRKLKVRETDLSDERACLQKHADDVIQLRKDLDSKLLDLQQREGRLEVKETELQQLQTELSCLQADLASFKADLDSRQSDLGLRCSELDIRECALDEQLQELRKREEAVEASAREVETGLQKIAGTEEAIEQARRRALDAELLVEQLQERAATATNDLTLTVEQLKSTREGLHSATTDLQASRQELVVAEQQLTEVKCQLDVVNAQLLKKTEEYDNLQLEFITKISEWEQATIDLKAVRQEVIALQQALEVKVEALASAESEVILRDEQLADLKARLAETVDALDAKNQEIASAAADVSLRAGQLVEIRSKLDEMAVRHPSQDMVKAAADGSPRQDLMKVRSHLNEKLQELEAKDQLISKLQEQLQQRQQDLLHHEHAPEEALPGPGTKVTERLTGISHIVAGRADRKRPRDTQLAQVTGTRSRRATSRATETTIGEDEGEEVASGAHRSGEAMLHAVASRQGQVESEQLAGIHEMDSDQAFDETPRLQTNGARTPAQSVRRSARRASAAAGARMMDLDGGEVRRGTPSRDSVAPAVSAQTQQVSSHKGGSEADSQPVSKIAPAAGRGRRFGQSRLAVHSTEMQTVVVVQEAVGEAAANVEGESNPTTRRPTVGYLRTIGEGDNGESTPGSRRRSRVPKRKDTA